MEYWVIKNNKADFEEIVNEFNLSEVTVRCLVNKGYEEKEDIKGFLYPTIDKLHNPMKLKDMETACDILISKIKTGHRIRIIGDYDVDGIVATYILYRTLKILGGKVDYQIPDRVEDGYGISIAMVEAAYEQGIDTIITCDNGIVARNQVEKAKEYGMTVIITDHHSLGKSEKGEFVFPDADAIINPKRPDCQYPFKELCGAAIAFKLSEALLGYHDIPDKEKHLEEMISYTALATVCDIMDLVNENRIIVKCGLDILKNTNNKGLLALMEVSKIDRDKLSTYHLGFVIGPCLNASGRLDSAELGLKLLLAQSQEEATELAREVRRLNDLRKDMTIDNVDKAVKQIEESSLKEDKILCIYLKDCHESIAGIIAGRIKESYYRPTIVLTDSKDGVKGSGRSIEHYNMIEELQKSSHLLDKVGGHPMAAGLSMKRDNIDLLRKSLNENNKLTDNMLRRKVTIDVELPLGYVDYKMIDELKILEPFGKGNTKPLFAERDLKIKSAFIIGKNSSGIRFKLENKYKKQMDGIYFGDVERFFNYIADEYGQEEADKIRTGRQSQIPLTITYYPKINEYRGFKNIQLMIENYR